MILILDVQSSVVRGSLVSLETGTRPEILFTYSTDIHYRNYSDSNHLIKMTLEAVSEIVKVIEHYTNTLEEKNRRKIHSIHFALSSPWLVSQARIIEVAFPKVTRITRAYILDLIKKERDKLMTLKDEPLTVIEEKVFDVRLNGYSVDVWEGKETKDLEISFAISIAGTSMIESLINKCSGLVREKNILFHSSLLLQYIGLQIIFPTNDNYSLINIHGELTDCVVVKRHSCASFGSISCGTRPLLRKIALESKIDEHAADSLVTLYTGGQLDASHSRESIGIIKKISDVWLNDLKKIYTSDKDGLSPPAFIMLSAYAHDDFYVKILSQASPTTQVKALSVDDIARVVSFADNVERRRLSGLYALALSNYVI